jgi:hypothetical protein
VVDSTNCDGTASVVKVIISVVLKEKGKGHAIRLQVRLYMSAGYLGTYTAGEVHKVCRYIG